MSTDRGDAGKATSEARSGLGDEVTSLYREYVGEPDEERDIYVGFGLFFGGIALGVVGLMLFFYSALQQAGSAMFWQLREIALVAVFLGLPATVVSIVVLLPVGRRTRAVSALGGVLCLVATGYFVIVYPYDWTGSATLDGSVTTISIYAVGLVGLSAATGAGLVAQYLDAAAPAAEQSRADDTEPSDGGDDTVSDEQVEADIESAMNEAELSWGGVEQQPNTKRLSLNVPDTDTDTDGTAIENADVNTTRSESDTVNDAVDNLRQLQGGETETERSSSTKDQVNALTEFREQQNDDEEVNTGVEEPGIIRRLLDRLFR